MSQNLTHATLGDEDPAEVSESDEEYQPPIKSAPERTPDHHTDAGTAKADTHDDAVTAELCGLYQTLQNCLDLREKYMKLSCQRWEDDPRNRDDWEVYPPPPPPSWPLPSPEEQARRREKERRREEDPVAAVGSDFEWEKCKIPGNHEFVFGMGPEGFYEVYQSEKDMSEGRPVYEIPGRREFFKDIDYVLNAISDGPAKSFAFRLCDILTASGRCIFS